VHLNTSVSLKIHSIRSRKKPIEIWRVSGANLQRKLLLRPRMFRPPDDARSTSILLMSVKRVGHSKHRAPRSLILKRTVVISERRTGVSLEDAFWNAMHEIALAKSTTRMALIRNVDKRRKQRKHLNLSSAIRLFALAYYQGLHR
jgi:predicted DNA-binding ribbon-helix-helix protein